MLKNLFKKIGNDIKESVQESVTEDVVKKTQDWLPMVITAGVTLTWLIASCKASRSRRITPDSVIIINYFMNGGKK